jgi:kynurenine formamidase
MNIADVAVFLGKARVIDLSRKVTPGAVEGPQGAPPRRYEIKPFSYPPGETMHYIEMESHISTHLEAPSHYVPVRYRRSAHDVSEMALSRFFGLAVLVDCRNLPARAQIDAALLEKHSIQEHDIVLIGNSPHRGNDTIFMVKDGAEYLYSKTIKLLGFDNTIGIEDLRMPLDLKNYYTHDLMLSNEIPVVEMLTNLNELKKSRFLFFAFPPKMGGLESFPVRAIAIEDAE